jgi:hypothetical protein
VGTVFADGTKLKILLGKETTVSNGKVTSTQIFDIVLLENK